MYGMFAMNVICAYPVNVDAVCNVSGSELSALLPSGFVSAKAGLARSINGFEDVLSSLLFCMQQGSGAELLIDSQAAAHAIEKAFTWQYRLGGNAGIMANVLSDLGAVPVLNAPAIGARLAEMLHSGVRLPLSGKLVEPARFLNEAQSCPEMMHFVFQFRKGDELALSQDKIIVSADNRFIASYDSVNTRLLTSQHFDSYCLENISDFDGALISGFHLAAPDEYRQIFMDRIKQLESWKRINPDLFIHLEMGSFQSPPVMQYLLDIISQTSVDSIGLNEDELAAAMGPSSPFAPSLHSPAGRWQETMQGAKLMQKHLGIFRVAVHTRDFILSIMDNGRIAAEDEMSALESGVNAASELAATGSLKGKISLDISSTGRRAVEEFRLMGASATGRGAVQIIGSQIVSLTPALSVKEPRITVGLGDTATAAIFFAELLADKRKLA